MKQRKISYQTSFNYDSKKFPGETNSGDTIVSPGEAYTVKELLIKHVEGTMPNITRRPIFDNPEDHEENNPFLTPDFDLVDKQEIEEHLQRVKEEELKSKKTKASKTEKAIESVAEETANSDKGELENKNLSKSSDNAEH